MAHSMKSGSIILLTLVLGLMAVLFLQLTPQEPVKKVNKLEPNHDYDYIIEVRDGKTDTTLIYTLYNSHHKLIQDNLDATQLDSVIILDNL